MVRQVAEIGWREGWAVAFLCVPRGGGGRERGRLREIGESRPALVECVGLGWGIEPVRADGDHAAPGSTIELAGEMGRQACTSPGSGVGGKSH